jgi:hypothetical protein
MPPMRDEAREEAKAEVAQKAPVNQSELQELRKDAIRQGAYGEGSSGGAPMGHAAAGPAPAQRHYRSENAVTDGKKFAMDDSVVSNARPVPPATSAPAAAQPVQLAEKGAADYERSVDKSEGLATKAAKSKQAPAKVAANEREASRRSEPPAAAMEPPPPGEAASTEQVVAYRDAPAKKAPTALEMADRAHSGQQWDAEIVYLREALAQTQNTIHQAQILDRLCRVEEETGRPNTDCDRLERQYPSSVWASRRINKRRALEMDAAKADKAAMPAANPPPAKPSEQKPAVMMH